MVKGRFWKKDRGRGSGRTEGEVRQEGRTGSTGDGLGLPLHPTGPRPDLPLAAGVCVCLCACLCVCKTRMVDVGYHLGVK